MAAQSLYDNYGISHGLALRQAVSRERFSALLATAHAVFANKKRISDPTQTTPLPDMPRRRVQASLALTRKLG